MVIGARGKMQFHGSRDGFRKDVHNFSYFDTHQETSQSSFKHKIKHFNLSETRYLFEVRGSKEYLLCQDNFGRFYKKRIA